MLRPRQLAICACLALAFWAAATLAIRLVPSAFTDPLPGALGFLASLPIGFLCIWLTCRLADLSPEQIPTACLVVLGDAMMIDGVALRWFHGVYAADEPTCRIAASWLLWGYGISAWAAILLARRRTEHARPHFA